MHRQLGDGPVAPDCRYRHLRLERRAVFLPCPLHVLLPRYPRFLGAGLHLSHLSHFRGPAHSARFSPRRIASSLITSSRALSDPASSASPPSVSLRRRLISGSSAATIKDPLRHTFPRRS